MSEPYLGEIRIFGFNFAPRGWAQCNGQLLSIAQNSALFSLLGTYYGGDGTTTFALPDLRSRAPVYQGNGLTIGESGGQEFHTLIQTEMPTHTHIMQASTAIADTPEISAATPFILATLDTGKGNLYAPDLGGAITMPPQTIATAGGSQPHNNMQPYLTLNFCIALQGIFPQRP